MDLVKKNGVMGANIKGFIKTLQKRDKENTNGQMETNLLVNGKNSANFGKNVGENFGRKFGGQLYSISLNIRLFKYYLYLYNKIVF